MSICKECLLDCRCHSVYIDAAGVCSYCRVSVEYEPVLSQIGKRAELLTDRLQQFRNNGPHDCLVGLSGGKDSSYTVYRLIRHYGARVLTYTCENGFLNDYARGNIERIIREFGVDHIWVRPDSEVLKAVYSASLRSDGWPCTGCFYVGEATSWKIAVDRRIPFIITGRTPDQMLRQPQRGDFESPFALIPENLSPYDLSRAVSAANAHAQRLRAFAEWLMPDSQLRDSASKYCFYAREESPFDNSFAPELISLFLFESYDERALIEELQHKTTWKPYHHTTILSHGDCAAHDAAGYLYYRSRGTPFLSLEIASCIRQGKLSREDAALRLREEIEHVSKYPVESMEALSKVCGMSEKRIVQTALQRTFPAMTRRTLRKIRDLIEKKS